MRNFKLIIWIVILIVSLIYMPVWAEENEEEIMEEEIIVTSTRAKEMESASPGMTQTISEDQIEQTGGRDISRVLTENGVTVSTYGGEFSVSTLSLDGSTSEQTMVMVNGIPVTAGHNGNIDLTLFPVEGVERIEITHGPLSSLYGANALGGVMNIITGLTGEVKNKLKVGTGSYGSHIASLTIKRKKWGLALGGSHTDGYRLHSQSNRKFISGQLDLISQNEDYLKMNLLYTVKNAEVPGSLDFPVAGAQSDSLISLDLSGKKNFLHGEWEYKLFNQVLKNSYTDTYTDDRHRAVYYGIDFAAFYNIPGHKILGGSVIRRDLFESTVTGENSHGTGGIFIQDNWFITRSINLVSGLRCDMHSVYGFSFSPRINFIKRFTDGFTA